MSFQLRGAMGVARFKLTGAIAAAGAEPGSRVFRVYVERPEQVRGTSRSSTSGSTRERGSRVTRSSPSSSRSTPRSRTSVYVSNGDTADRPRSRPASHGGRPGGDRVSPASRAVARSRSNYLTAQHRVRSDPTLALWLDVGDSWEKTTSQGGYDLRALRLTNNAIPGPKPKLFITSSIHATALAYRRSWRLARGVAHRRL